MIRPGPPWIERNAAPGGLVLHVYAVADPPLLILTRPLPADADVELEALADGDLVARLIAVDQPVVIVVYDGDTGERMRPTGLVQ